MRSYMDKNLCVLAFLSYFTHSNHDDACLTTIFFELQELHSYPFFVTFIVARSWYASWLFVWNRSQLPPFIAWNQSSLTLWSAATVKWRWKHLWAMITELNWINISTQKTRCYVYQRSILPTGNNSNKILKACCSFWKHFHSK